MNFFTHTVHTPTITWCIETLHLRITSIWFTLGYKHSKHYEVFGQGIVQCLLSVTETLWCWWYYQVVTLQWEFLCTCTYKDMKSYFKIFTQKKQRQHGTRHTCGTVYYGVQGGSYFCVCGWNPKCDHSNENYCQQHFPRGTVYYAIQGSSTLLKPEVCWLSILISTLKQYSASYFLNSKFLMVFDFASTPGLIPTSAFSFMCHLHLKVTSAPCQLK